MPKGTQRLSAKLVVFDSANRQHQGSERNETVAKAGMADTLADSSLAVLATCLDFTDHAQDAIFVRR
jgi:NAD(P)H-hydrate repair Nnr-like enzyme with NAD(P)H-hydrate dehydratase domain